MINRFIDGFLLKDFISNVFYKKNKYKVGWIVPYNRPYNRVIASTRIRAYDIINFINTSSTGFISSLYRKYSYYDIVVFQRVFKKRFQDLAAFLKKKNIKVVFDINVNYVSENITRNSTVTDQQKDDVKRMISLADSVITPTKYLYNIYKKYHDNVVLIEESISKRFYDYCKEHADGNIVKLIYCGYAIKAQELKPIAHILKKQYAKKINIITICEQDPKLDFLEYEYVYFDYAKLPEILLKGDICIVPRDLTVEYNLGHTFTKIGYPMSVGLCVLASPVPSYRGSPAVVCNNPDEWENNLSDLITNVEKRRYLAKLGRAYCMNNYSLEVIGEKYIEYFNKIILSR